MLQEVTPQWLQSIEALKEVPLSQLAWLLEHSEQVHLKEGDYLAEAGSALLAMHIIVEGKLRLSMMQQNQMRELALFMPGDITGYLPFSRAKLIAGTVVALEDSHILRFSSKLMPELIQTQYELTQALVHVLTDRVREFTNMQQQNEKMMALGKLSAGLAHELNNPAAAIVRDSTTLVKNLHTLPQYLKDLAGLNMEGTAIDAITQKLSAVFSNPVKPALGLLQRSAAEDELNDWLYDNGITDGCETAEIFTEYSLSTNDLEEFSQHIPPQQLPSTLKWITNTLVAERLANDIKDSAKRISDLVASVKNFTHMDRAQDKQLTDIHSGIRNTLTMLAHKLKKGNVKLIENYDADLPQVNALIGELNQVWTNLIDNALDALEGTPNATLEIATQHEHNDVKINIIDNGPGVPNELLTRIFEPFFTTKDIGKGTGLGLDVVQRIIKQHHGSIKVTSVPGHTTFAVCIPVNG